MAKTLNKLFSPKAIALIGASRDKSSVGYGIAKSLLKGGVFSCKYNKPFKGDVFLINPNAKNILGKRCYASVKEIKSTIDLAVIAVPAKIVPKIMQECSDKKIKAVIIISAGFSELGKEGKELEKKAISIAKKAGIRVVGPNCLGIIRTSNSMNASFAPAMPPEGSIALISQSGALADSIIDWALENRYGFSTIISYGNKADLDAYDFLEWLEKDKETKVITMYIEGVKDGRKLIKIAKRVGITKPIIALKAGKSKAGTKAISSHTGSLAGDYEIYKAAFEKAGIIEAETVEEMFDMAKALAEQPPLRRNGIAIITNGGGVGVLTADYCEKTGLKLSTFKIDTIKQLDKSGKMHSAYSRKNPLDIIGDALSERYEAALNIVLKDRFVHGAIVLQTLQTMTEPLENAKIIIKAKKKFPEKPIICVYMGGKFSSAGIKYLEEHNIPDYNDPRKAARAMYALLKRGQRLFPVMNPGL